MFFKGLLFGIGWITGTGIAITMTLGLMALTELAHKLVAGFGPAKDNREDQEQRTTSHQANLILVMRLPATPEERMDMRSERTQYLQ